MPQRMQKWMKNTISNTETRLVLFITIAIFLIILLVGITSYYSSKSVLQDQLNEPQQQMLQISMNLIDEYITDSNKTAINIALDPHVNEFLKSNNQNSYYNITRIYDLLSTMINNSSYIKSIYIYDTEKDSFVSMPQGFSSKKLTFIDSEWVDIADEFGDERMIVKKRVIPEGARSRSSEITLFRKIMMNGDLRGIIAINLEEKDLFSKLNPSQTQNMNSIRFITDGNNEMLYSETNQFFAQGTIDEMITNLREKGLREIDYDGNKLLGNIIQSPLTGWNYVSFVSQDKLLAKSKKIRDIVFSVSLLALLLGFVTIFRINTVAFKPIRRMKQLFKVKDGEIDRHDLLHLENLTGDLMSNYTDLSDLVRKVKTEAVSKFFQDIYTGNMNSKEEIHEKWDVYFQGWAKEPYTIAIISIDNYPRWLSKFPESDHSLLKFALTNIVSEVLSSNWRNECVDLGKDKIVILLQSTEKKASLEIKMLEAVSVISRMLEFSISISFSNSQSDVGALPQAVKEAKDTLGLRLYKGYGSLLTFNELTNLDKNEVTIKEEYINNLAEIIESGDTSKAVNMVRSMIEIIREKQCIPLKVLAFIVRLEERFQHMNKTKKGEVQNEQDIWNKLETMDLVDMEKDIVELVDRLAESSRLSQQQKEYVVCEQMIMYMKQNLDKQIGIPEIAESVSISVSLASQIFKDIMNETIYGYFTKLRMDYAAELLLNTEEKMSTIAMKVGYQHENSFIRVFRKYKDVTPGKYREMTKYRKSSEENTSKDRLIK
ncbi:AraC family transcriptional regulator [Evansella sp. AB-rgal1]|uniref:AraC family transcriptional regulator n=1 Tax=Evansella sp. AB-rgal1 TaxID=3242696 RepID=UPI00359D37AE